MTTAPSVTAASDLALHAVFPALRALPRVSLCAFPSPVTRVTLGDTSLWIKEDGLNSPVCGGNKARTLEFLLGRVQPHETVLAVGGEGSTHVLATAIHARRLGARTIAVRWRHEMNDTAERIADLVDDECVLSPVHRTTGGALLHSQLLRLSQRVHYIPMGGSTPAGVLAHVNAALELAAQVRAGLLPLPGRVVVALGSGGTVAGLALGFAIAGMETAVIGVQVTPAIVANRTRVQHLALRTARLILRVTGVRVPRVPVRLLGVARNAYGGAYGRAVPQAIAAARDLYDCSGMVLDQTYSAKAFAVARELARDAPDSTLFWNTFDARLLA